MLKIISKFFPSKHAKDVKLVQPIVDEINRLYAEYNSLSDDELRAKKLKNLKIRLNLKLKKLKIKYSN